MPVEDADGVALHHCRVWLKWAAAQVEECLAEDGLAGGDLLRALTEVLGPQQPGSSGSAHAAHTEGREMSAVVVAVQSHDRVMQRLAHVAEALHALHAQLGEARAANSAEAWRRLRDARYRAFSMAQERTLFARMVAHEDELGHEPDLTPEETVELFTGNQGFAQP